MYRSLKFVSLLLLAWGSGCWFTPAGAALYSYPIQNPPEKLTRTGQPSRSVAYRVYLDPARIQWMAWSTTNTVTSYQGHRVFNTPQGQTSPAVRVTITDPSGHRAQPVTMGQQSGQLRLGGSKAVLYGLPEAVPAVTAFNDAGQVSFSQETGQIDQVVNEAGSGVYTIQFDFIGDSPINLDDPAFLLIETMDEHPPVGGGGYVPDYGAYAGSSSPSWGNSNNNSSSKKKKDNPTPVVPEPASLGLISMGLGLLLWKRRRAA